MTSSYKIPSATKKVCLTETELLAIKFPAQKFKPGKKWIPLPGEELRPAEKPGDGYFISNFGRLLHQRTRKDGRLVETEIKGKLAGKKKFALVTNGSRGKQTCYFNRMVLEAFDPNPNSGHLVGVNLDLNPDNNNLSNLKWMTLKECRQYQKSVGMGLGLGKYREYVGRDGKRRQRKVKYSDFEVSEMRRLGEAGISARQISIIFGCDQSYVCNIMKNKQRPDAGLGTTEENN